jgi:hypothetical protein
LARTNDEPVRVLASLDEGRLLERDLVEANRAEAAIHHPVPPPPEAEAAAADADADT